MLLLTGRWPEPSVSSTGLRLYIFVPLYMERFPFLVDAITQAAPNLIAWNGHLLRPSPQLTAIFILKLYLEWVRAKFSHLSNHGLTCTLDDNTFDVLFEATLSLCYYTHYTDLFRAYVKTLIENGLNCALCNFSF